MQSPPTAPRALPPSGHTLGGETAVLLRQDFERSKGPSGLSMELGLSHLLGGGSHGAASAWPAPRGGPAVHLRGDQRQRRQGRTHRSFIPEL